MLSSHGHQSDPCIGEDSMLLLWYESPDDKWRSLLALQSTPCGRSLHLRKVHLSLTRVVWSIEYYLHLVVLASHYMYIECSNAIPQTKSWPIPASDPSTLCRIIADRCIIENTTGRPWRMHGSSPPLSFGQRYYQQGLVNDGPGVLDLWCTWHWKS